jgi:hypothetical protein
LILTWITTGSTVAYTELKRRVAAKNKEIELVMEPCIVNEWRVFAVKTGRRKKEHVGTEGEEKRMRMWLGLRRSEVNGL